MKDYKQMIAEANALVESMPAADAVRLLDNTDVAFVDLRDTPELERDGKIPGAIHASRGMLEFLIDRTSPYHNVIFSSGKRLVFYCATGGRSALAAQTAQSMGLTHVAHISGGLRAWKEASGPVQDVRCVDSA